MIHILHLSDIHLGTKDDANQYRSQLSTDLTVELEIEKLDYLVVSGDIGTYSTKEEYEAAAELITQIAKRFDIRKERLIIAPGNHDLNWKLSEKAYPFVPKSEIPDPMPDDMAEKAVSAGPVGWLVRDDKKYRKRFAHFSKHFYEPVAGKPYPEKEDDQGIVSIDRDNRIVFLAMNSCWEIDHHNKDRASIHRNALAHVLDVLDQKGCVGEDWLKIAVWHHPVTGAQTIKDTAFLQQLSVRGIKVALHGHIHEAEKGHYDYDTERGIHLVGAGTFGAPAPEQVPGIPHQYNLLVYDREKGEITVHTRKKDKPMGAWDPDYRWGKKSDKKPWYTIRVHGPKKSRESDEPEPDETPPQKEIDDHRKESLHASPPLGGLGVVSKDASKMPVLTWLHLSDMHFCDPKTGWESRRVFEQLLEDLKELEKKEGLRPDLIFFTGDLAFGNLGDKEGMDLPAQFAGADERLDEIRRAFSIEVPKENVFLTPGNHDIDFKKASKHFIAWLKAQKDDKEIVETIRDGGLDWDNCMRPLDDYRKFLKESGYAHLVDQDPERLIYGLVREIDGVKVGVGAFNSVWAWVDKSEEQRGKLWMAADWQCETIAGRMAGADFGIGLAHVPPNWLVELEERSLKKRIAQNFRFYLHGHEHDNWVSTEDSGLTTLSAGAFYQDKKRDKGYGMVRLNFSKAEGQVFLRSYDFHGGGWVPRIIKNKSDDPYGVAKLTGLPWLEELSKKLSALGPEMPGPNSAEVKNGATSRKDVPAAMAKSFGKEDVLLETAWDPEPDQTPTQKEIEDYRKKCESLHASLPLVGFGVSLRVPIRLEDIYVPLRAMVDTRLTGKACFADAADAEDKLRECGGGNEISVPDAFQEAKKVGRRGVVILGDPGSGKTTHLKRVLLWCLKGGPESIGLPPDMLPVFLPLRELRDTRMKLEDFIRQQLDLPHLETPEGFGRRLMKRGNLIFLLDGLDEVAESDRRSGVSRWIEKAHDLYDTCWFAVTSRFAGYTEKARLGPQFLEMHMRPLSEDQASRFIHNWYGIVKREQQPDDPSQAAQLAEDEAERLIERLKAPGFRASRVFEMTRNPLLLTCLCLVHLDRGNLPHTRAALYEECIDVLLERWRSAVDIRTKVTARAGRRVLQPVALWMHREENRTRASAGELAPVMEKPVEAVGWAHGSAEDFLKAVRDESGLLVGWDRKNYGFMHLGFQEYLAAREIRNLYLSRKNESILKELAGHFGEAWWQEVCLLLLAVDEDPSLFVDFMNEATRLPAFAENLQLVEMCLEDSVEVHKGPFIDLVKRDPAGSKELWKRQLAALRILERMDEKLVAGMAPALANHPDRIIREWIGSRAGEAERPILKAKLGGYELVCIPAGEFLMGSLEKEEGRWEFEGPQHKVAVESFYMGRYPVTNEEYGRFLEENPEAKKPDDWGDRKFNQPNQPVVGVSWHDAEKYAKWAGLELPTEPQWEYACRAGTQTRFYTGDTVEDLDRAGWYDKNSGDRLHPVGEKEPNAWGLYDMHGNVWEWTRSLWGKKYDSPDFPYPYDPSDGREDMSSGAQRVVRGGSWDCGAGLCRSAYRDGHRPGLRIRGIGFRLACLPLAKKEESKK